MDTSNRQLWVASCLGALDPGDLMRVREAAHHKPELALHMGGVAALIGGVPPQLPDAPDLGSGHMAPQLGEALPVVGGRYRLQLNCQVPSAKARCVVVRMTPSAPALLHPTPGRTWPLLSRFPHQGGCIHLDIVLAPPAGLHEYRIVVVPSELFELCDMGFPWAEVLRAYERKWLPGLRHSVVVGEAP